MILEGITVTNPQKLVFTNPDVSKGELAEYYLKIARRMMPHVEKRILSLVCCPKGVKGECFYKKHLAAGGQGMVKVAIESSGGNEHDYFYIDGVAGLIYQVQMNTLEFHTWGSRADEPDKPDVMVFDLDPDEGMGLDQIRQGVRDLKSVLEELSLKPYLKTSGGKGYHVVVPFAPSTDWQSFRDFSKSVATVLEQRWSDRYTSNIRKASRKGKIFIDWIRNTRGATSIAPYSVRARNGARVSMPIAWSELDKIAPNEIDTIEALRRLSSKDPWSDYFKTAASQRLV